VAMSSSRAHCGRARAVGRHLDFMR
jgi:hypothetical protein